MQSDERLIRVAPSERQIRFQRLEFYAFIHFTVNTFTDKEWGDGTESPAVFAPSRLDAEQWARAVQSAGMKGLILTCKHHDGFCLWDTKQTPHNVMNSPYGKDVVRQVSQACRRHGLAFGVYLSPWDRNCPLYGSGKAYDDFFVAQLTELLTGYGEVFSVWFDGACGEGPNGRRQIYDWQRYYAAVRALQPGACISVCGPDIRWCGNEAGHTRRAEWSVVPLRARDSETVAAKSQQEDGEAFRRRVDARDEDLGSREALANETELIWYPAEVNTSIRPGWFWHARENDKVRPLEELFDIYLKSVGGNATFLLNIPPTDEGLLHENDVRRLSELGALLRKSFAVNIAPEAEITSGGRKISGVLTDDDDSFFAPEGRTAEITIRFNVPERLGFLVMKENIRMSQRVERFAVDVCENGGFRTVYDGTVIGYKRIVPLNGALTDCLRVRITDSRVSPTLAFIGVYRAEKERGEQIQ
ncbi:MAG: alpha-L-fucosidase [Clostridia bacterium]|nr:alpha-L-fucosidase [Clostridia bacterium]